MASSSHRYTLCHPKEPKILKFNTLLALPSVVYNMAADLHHLDIKRTATTDANTWPTWGALRERVLTACKEVIGVGQHFSLYSGCPNQRWGGHEVIIPIPISHDWNRILLWSILGALK
jgi:hypothetical protein